MFSFSRKYHTDYKAANDSLQAILSECNMAPSSLPFDKIKLRQTVNTIFYNICIFTTSLFLFLTLLSPLFFHYYGKSLQSEDLKHPVIQVTGYSIEDHQITLKTDTGLSMSDCYITYSNGQTSSPVSYDELTNIIVFSLEDSDFSIKLVKPNGISATVYPDNQ